MFMMPCDAVIHAIYCD